MNRLALMRVVNGGMGVVLCLALLAGSVAAQATPPQPDASSVTIYFVRHGEVDGSDPTIPLAVRGHERASELVRVLERVDLTHVFASHTLRARQAVAPVAASQGLTVVPLPSLGSRVEGQQVDGVSPSRLAITPLADALSELPDGSRALVGVNSDNLFGVLNRLGVPLATPAEPCTLGRTCVPCLDNSCYPRSPP